MIDINNHIENVKRYRAAFSGNLYDVVSPKENAQIVMLIENGIISHSTGKKLLEMYFILHNIRMGIETEEEVYWLIDFLKLDDKQ